MAEKEVKKETIRAAKKTIKVRKEVEKEEKTRILDKRRIISIYNKKVKKREKEQKKVVRKKEKTRKQIN